MKIKPSCSDKQYDRILSRLDYSELEAQCECIKKENCPLCRTYLYAVSKIQPKKKTRKAINSDRSVNFLRGIK